MEIDGDEDMRAFDEAEMPMGHVPLAALHAERGKRQAAERARDELLAQLNGDVGDGGGDPDEVAEAPDAEWPEDEARLDGDLPDDPSEDLAELNDHLNASEAVARSSFGDDAVDAAEAWAERAMREDPSLAAEVLSHPNPYAFALGFAMSAGGRGPATATNFAPRPPRSLATLPSAGGAAHVPAGPGQAYDTVFGGR